MFLHVERVSYINDYRLRIGFSDGAVKDVDLAGELHGEIFEPLKETRFLLESVGQSRHVHDRVA